MKKNPKLFSYIFRFFLITLIEAKVILLSGSLDFKFSFMQCHG